ncbi:hypothetical protein D3C81_2255990 [compost metagenome]
MSQRLVANIRVQLLQIDGGKAYRRLILVLGQVTRSGFPPGSDPADAVDLLFPELFQLVYQVLLCLLPIA